MKTRRLLLLASTWFPSVAFTGGRTRLAARGCASSGRRIRDGRPQRLTAGGLALGLGLMLPFQGPAAQVVVGTVPAPSNQLSLTATAAAEVPLDVLSVTLAVTREGPEATAVQAELTQALETALAEARPQARPGQLEVRTGSFSLSPRYAPAPARGGNPGPVIAGWIGRAELHLEGRDQKAVAQLAGRIPSMNVAGVAFSLSRQAREAAEVEVTREAIAGFRARAKAYAQQFGFADYRLREVQVGLQYPPGAMPVRASMARALASAPMVDAALPAEAGQTTVSVSVSGSVELVR